MTQEELRNLFTEDYERLQLLLEESFKKIFMTGLKVEYTLSDESQAKTFIGAAELPVVAMSLEITTENTFNHLFISRPDLYQELYRRFVNGEEKEELQAEHLAGLQEVLDQVLEDFKADYEGAGLPFAVKSRNLELISTPEELDVYLEGEGLGIDYQVSVGEEQFSVKHFLTVSEEEIVAETEEEPESLEAIPEEPLSEEEEAPVAEIEEEAEPTAEEPSLDTPDEEEMEQVGVHPVEFDTLPGEGQPQEQSRNLDILMDVELEVVAELGRKTMTIKEILKLGKRSIIELDKAAGEPLEIFVNGHKFAEGEVVVVDDQFGIRLINLVSPEERIKNLA